MRKNRTKHEAKKPRLAKRALALCFALIFVCSCLLPAFANSEAGALTDPLTMVEEQDEQKLEDSAPLNEGGTDSTEGNEEQDEQKQEEANASKETSKELTSSSSGEASGESQSTAPSESASSEGSASTAPGESASSSSASSEASGEPEQPASSETKTEETKPEEPKQPTTNTTGDTIEQGKATYTYRFWPDKIDAFDLEAINADVKSGTSLNDAAQSRAGKVPCTVLTVMTNANLRDYQANVQQPTKDGYEFAGWYTVDGTTEDEFSFEQSLNFEKSKTIDVFAKWNELKAVKSDALSNGGMTVEAKVGPMANVKSVALAEPNQSDAETLRNSIDKQLYDQSYMVTIFDITPKDKDGMDVEPQNGESVNVEISGLDFSAGDNVWVYHLTNSGRVETLSATVTSDGSVEFTTKSFSPFAVVKLTEGMVGFGTEDDRLATADLSEEGYTMTVGDSMTLYGKDSWRINHQWGSNDPAVVEVSGNGSSATVKAKKAGTAIVTHTCGLNSNHVERATITVKEDPTPYPQYVYLYTKIDSDVNEKLKLTKNDDGWFTVGYIEMSNFLKPTSSRQNPKWKDESPYYLQVVNALNETSVTRFGKNSHVHLSNIDWNHPDVTDNNTHTTEQFGLVSANGASDYNDKHNIPLESNHQYAKRWHLDGYIDSIGAVRVNYYIKGTKTRLQDSVEYLGTPGETFTLNDAPEELTDAKGLTYKRHSYDPANSVVFPNNSTTEINVYYVRNTLDVTIVKHVEDTTRDFYFQVTSKQFGSNENVQVYDRNGKILDSHEDTFALANGDSAKICGLKKDYQFVVREYYYYTDSAGNAVDKDGKPSSKQIPIEYDTSATNYKAIPAGTTGKNFTYKVVEDADGSLVLQALDKSDKLTSTELIRDGKIEVTNTRTTTSLTVKKTVEAKSSNTTIPDDTFTFKLTVSKDLNAKQLEGITFSPANAVVTSNTAGEWTIKLKANESVTFSGIRVDDPSVTVTETDPGTHYTTSYKINGGEEQKYATAQIPDTTLAANKQNGTTVEFINTYTLQKLDGITITKKVTGEFGERDKNFTFKVELKDKNDQAITVTGENYTFSDNTSNRNLTSFTLKNGKYVTLNQIPVDTTIVITETDAGGYKTSATKHFTNYGETATERVFKYKVVADKDGNAVLMTEGKVLDLFDTKIEDNAITVTNDKPGIPDTGVLLDTLPYLILLAVAVAGGVLVVVRKRKHRDE